MKDASPDVQTHYHVDALIESVLKALQRLGRDVDDLRHEDLAAVDAFHIRGRDATLSLMQDVNGSESLRVLDVGSGIGGTARLLAATWGAHVTGLDLSATFTEAAKLLSARVGLQDSTSHVEGSATDMPFEDGSFDIVWTEHAQMNIADKESFYGEMVRVLRPGGRLAFHDIFQGPKTGLTTPVPWAGTPAINFLATAGSVRERLRGLGLREIRWEDTTEKSASWYRETAARNAETGPPPLGLHLLMGADSKAKFVNMIENFAQQRVTTFEAVLEKPN